MKHAHCLACQKGASQGTLEQTLPRLLALAAGYSGKMATSSMVVRSFSRLVIQTPIRLQHERFPCSSSSCSRLFIRKAIASPTKRIRGCSIGQDQAHPCASSPGVYTFTPATFTLLSQFVPALPSKPTTDNRPPCLVDIQVQRCVRPAPARPSQALLCLGRSV